MSPSSFSVVIADSSRLGSVMLERLLAPLLDVQVCTDAGGLDTSLQQSPSVLMIANQWPGLEALLSGLAARLPALGIVLMASPESDAARIASLSERFRTGVVYRPYDARQVIRELLRLASTGQPGSDVPIVMDAAPDPLDTLQRDQAFCRRHHLPHSLLALRVDEYATLSKQLGDKALLGAERTLLAMITDNLRREDHLCEVQPGRMVLSLPGTPAQGARVLAHRLCQRSAENEIDTGEFTAQLSLLAGIHVITSDSDDLHQEIAQAMAVSDLANSEDDMPVLLSDSACDQLNSTAPPLLQSQQEPASAATESETPWEHLSVIFDQDDAAISREAMQQLSGILRRLDENSRMTLVDELLMASAMPE